MNEEQLIDMKQYLRENLSLNVETQSHMSGAGPYEWKECHTIQLLLDGEVISEEYL